MVLAIKVKLLIKIEYKWSFSSSGSIGWGKWKLEKPKQVAGEIPWSHSMEVEVPLEVDVYVAFNVNKK